MKRYEMECNCVYQSIEGGWCDWEDVQALQTKFTLAMLLLSNVDNIDGYVSDVLLNEINKFMEESKN